MASSSCEALRSRAVGLVQPGRIEIALAILLAAVAALLEVSTGQAWGGLVIDFFACAAVAVAAKWPRAGAAILALALVTRGLAPGDWATMSEYAPLIPILGAGMRGDFKLRNVLSAVYLPLLCWISFVEAGPQPTLILGWFVWAVLIGIMWLIGTAFHAVAEAHRQARAAELVLQRQVLARELHDTVARSFTRVSMVAERARLRGRASPEDLASICEEAAKGVDDLRWVMTLLRDPANSVDALAAGRSSLSSALEAAEAGLERDGFNATLSVVGDLTRLNSTESETLAAVTAEAAANMTRHGDSHQPSGIVVQVGETEVELAFINSPAAGRPADPSRQHLGVWGMRQRLEGLNGTVRAGLEEQYWVTRVRLPLGQGNAKGVS